MDVLIVGTGSISELIEDHLESVFSATVTIVASDKSPTDPDIDNYDVIIISPSATTDLHSTGWALVDKPILAHNWSGGTIDRLRLVDTTFGSNGSAWDTFMYAMSATARTNYPEMFLDGENQEQTNGLQLTNGAEGGQRELGDNTYAPDSMAILRRDNGNFTQNICVVWESGGDDLDTNTIPARRILWPIREQHLSVLNTTGWEVWDLLLSWAANVTVAETYDLTLNTVGEGGITPDPTPPYVQGADTLVELTADPSEGWVVDDPIWTGDIDSGEQNLNPAEVVMDQHRSVTANFVLDSEFIPNPSGLDHTVDSSTQATAVVNAWDDAWSAGKTVKYIWWIDTTANGIDPNVDEPYAVTDNPTVTFTDLTPETSYDYAVAYGYEDQE